MNNQILRAAIAAAIGAGAIGGLAASAQADAVIYVSGASAQRTFWEKDIEAIATGTFGSTSTSAAGKVCGIKGTAFNSTGHGVTDLTPDQQIIECTVQGTGRGSLPIPNGIASGDKITMYYAAELGSVWGIAPFIPGNASGGKRSFIDTVAAGCNPGFGLDATCTVSGYSRDYDTATSGLLAPVTVDIGVADMEPVLWSFVDNWPYDNTLNGGSTYPALAPQPTLSQLSTLQSTWNRVNGQVFSVIVDNQSAPGSGITNLSTQSVRSIFTGAYTTWSQVPEVGTAVDTASGGTPIVVCRRDHGSGTEVATSLLFAQTECGGNNGGGIPPRIVSSADSALGAAGNHVAAANVIESFSTDELVDNCVNGHPGAAIGIRSVANPNGSVAPFKPVIQHYTTLSLDNVQPNAHNAALGTYHYAFDTWAYNNTANSQPGTEAASLATALFTDARKPGTLVTESGSFAGGVWTTTSPQSTYGVQGTPASQFNAIPSVTAETTASTATTTVPVAVWANSAKSSCAILTNNSNP